MKAGLHFLVVVVASCVPGSEPLAARQEAVSADTGSTALGAGTPGDLSATNLSLANLNVGFGTAPAALPPAPTIVENWNPWGTATRTTLVRVVTASQGSILGSLAAGKVGDIVILENHGDGSGSYGAGDLKILFRRTNDLGAIVANHIYQPNLMDIVIPYTGAIVLYYDATNVGWIPISMSLGGKFERVAFDEVSIGHPLTPAALEPGMVADYDPAGGQFGGGQRTATWLRLNGNASGTSAVSGLVPYFQMGPMGTASQGPIKIIENLGGPITLLSEDASSQPLNRFSFPNGSIVIPPNGIQVLIYDTNGGGYTNPARWRALTPTGAFSKLTLYSSVTDNAMPPVVNDYCPTNFDATSRLRLTPATYSTQLTGLCAQEDGAIRTITAFGPNLTLKHQSPASGSTNRFYLPNGQDVTLQAAGSVIIVYDAGLGAWTILARS